MLFTEFESIYKSTIFFTEFKGEFKLLQHIETFDKLRSKFLLIKITSLSCMILRNICLMLFIIIGLDF